MNIERLYVLNMAETPKEQVFRDDLSAAFSAAEVTFLDTSTCVIEAGEFGTRFVSEDTELSLENAAVFVRSRKKDSSFAGLFSVLLRDKGVPFNDMANVYHSDYADKSYCIPRLAEHGLTIPHTVIGSLAGIEANLTHIESVITYPCVLKGDGSRGNNVHVVQNRAELRATAHEIVSKKPTLLSIQEYIENEYDIRALFMGSECLAAMRRTAQAGSFFNNISLGGTATAETLSPAEILACQRAVAVSDIDFAGVDFIRREDGSIVFLEVNKTPQLGGIRTVHPELSVGDAFRRLIENSD